MVASVIAGDREIETERHHVSTNKSRHTGRVHPSDKIFSAFSTNNTTVTNPTRPNRTETPEIVSRLIRKPNGSSKVKGCGDGEKGEGDRQIDRQTERERELDEERWRGERGNEKRKRRKKVGKNGAWCRPTRVNPNGVPIRDCPVAYAPADVD